MAEYVDCRYHEIHTTKSFPFISVSLVSFRDEIFFSASSHGVQFPGVAPAFPYLRLSFRVRGSNYSNGTKNHEPRTSF